MSCCGELRRQAFLAQAARQRLIKRHCAVGTDGRPHPAVSQRPPTGASRAVCAAALTESGLSAGEDEQVQRGRLDGVEKALGGDGLKRLQGARVCVVGIGGVGSWAAEALARSGVGHLSLVDLDEVCVSNVNRQVHALTSTVGRPKGEAMASRIRDINPDIEVEAVADFLGADNVEELLAPAGKPPFDFVLDGVDRDLEKALIIDFCCRRSIPVMTVGGTGGVTVPEGLKVVDLNHAGKDRLLFRTRKVLRKNHGWRSEPPYQRMEDKPLWGIPCVTIAASRPESLKGQRGNISCNAAGGSLCFVTGAVGFFAAAHIANMIAAPVGEDGTMEADEPVDGSDDAVVNKADSAAPPKPWEPVVGEPTEADKKLEAHRKGSIKNSTHVDVSLETAAEIAKLDLFDAHCHPQLGPRGAEQDFASEAPKLQHVGLMATQESDWAACCAIADSDPGRCLLALGIHPWFAHLVPSLSPETDDLKDTTSSASPGSTWLSRLEDELEGRPTAVVGEIGLDKKWRTPDTGGVEYEAQLVVFKEQMALATRLRRPVVLHCVQAWGGLIEALRGAEELPPAIFLHSYGGTAGFTTSLLKLKGGIGERLYFGFSATINLRSPKTRGVIALIPDGQILLESDVTEAVEMQADCQRMLQIIAEAKKWRLDFTASKTTENAKRFYRSGSSSSSASSSEAAAEQQSAPS